jgi:hypothetical protein
MHESEHGIPIELFIAVFASATSDSQGIFALVHYILVRVSMFVLLAKRQRE